MKITLDGIDGRNFTLRLPRDAGGEHVVALHDTRGLRGLYAHDASRFSLDPVEADAITGELTLALESGGLRLAGPAKLGATRLALEIRRDDATPALTGAARCASLDAADLRFDGADLALRGGVALTGLDARHDPAARGWSVTLATLAARGASLARGGVHLGLEGLDAAQLAATLGDALALRAETLALGGLALRAEGLDVAAARADLTGLRVTRDARGEPTLRVDRAELGDVTVTRGATSVQLPSLTLEGLAYGPDGASLDRLRADRVAVAVTGLGATPATPATPAAPAAPAAPAGRRTLGLDLPFLDGLGGRVTADIVVDVKLPIVGGRVATHRLRLDLREGALDFKQLESGLSALEDAVIDFEVDDGGLYLEVDTVVVKRELVRWPLDAEGLRLARQHRVRLRTFAQPTLAAPAPAPAPAPRGDDRGAPAVALRRVTVRALRADLAVAGSSVLPVAGGSLRLGSATADALRALSVAGELAYDPADATGETAVDVTLDGLVAALEGLRLGARRVDVASVSVGADTAGRVTFRGFAPTAVSLDLRGLALEGLRLAPATDDAPE